jgi:DNA-binding NarL/FixJ family response regulator
MGQYRILLADDHALVREGIKSIIARDPSLLLVGEAGDGLELLRSLKTCEPDLIILDISMPHLDGLETLKKIKTDYPKIKILILTMHKSKGYLLLAFSAGTDGYLLKGDVFEDLFAAITKIRQGGRYISTLMSDQIVDCLRRVSMGQSSDDGPSLSSKDLLVLQLIAHGKSMKQIAEQLALALPTVHYHVKILKKKFNTQTSAGLVTHALEKGYICID